MKKSLVGINPRIGGSVALKHWLGDKYWNQSSPKDIDWFGYSLDNHLKSSLEVTPNFLHTNVSTREEFFSVDLCEPLRVLLKRNQDDTYLDLKTLLIIKNAHKHFYRGKYSKSFKHLIDYSNLKALIPLTEEDEALSEQYRLWMIEWVYYNDKRLIRVPSLNKSKDAFFTDGVTYYVDHDYIHERVKIKDKPAYTLCLTGEVMFSTSIFDSLPFEDKVNMVLEESFVLALERCLIPIFKGETYVPSCTPQEAFKYALVRVATNITSGKFRAFAADNFALIYKEYETKHTDYFKVIGDLLNECS